MKPLLCGEHVWAGGVCLLTKGHDGVHVDELAVSPEVPFHCGNECPWDVPRLFMDSANRVVNGVAVIVAVAVALLLLLNEQLVEALSLPFEGVHPAWAIVPILVLVAYGVMKANYAEIEKRDAEIRFLGQEEIYQLVKSMHESERRWVESDLSPDGYVARHAKHLLERLDRPSDEQAAIAAEIDDWLALAKSGAGKHADVLTNPIDPSLTDPDWRERCRINLRIWLNRVDVIYHKRLADLDEDEEKREAAKEKRRAKWRARQSSRAAISSQDRRPSQTEPLPPHEWD